MASEADVRDCGGGGGVSMLKALPARYQETLKIREVYLAPRKTVATEIRKYLAGKTGSLPSDDVNEFGRVLGTLDEKALREWYFNLKRKLDPTGPAQTKADQTPDLVSTAEVVDRNTGNSIPPVTVYVQKKKGGGEARKPPKTRTVAKKTAHQVKEEEALAASLVYSIRSGFTKVASFAGSVMEFVEASYVLHRQGPTDILKNGYGRGAMFLLLGCLLYFFVLPAVVVAPTEFAYELVADLLSQVFRFHWTISAGEPEMPQEKCLISDGETTLLDYERTKMMEDDLSALQVKWTSKTPSINHTDAEQDKEILSRANETVLELEKKYVLTESKVVDDGASLSKRRAMPRLPALVAPRRFGFPPLKEHMTGRDPVVEALTKENMDLQAKLDRVIRVLENNLETKEALEQSRKRNEELSRMNWYLGALMGGGVVTGMVVIGGPVAVHSLGLTTIFSMGLWAWESISVADLIMLGGFGSIFMDPMDDIDRSM